MKSIFKYLLIALVIGLVGYNSVYFKKLSTVNRTATTNFDAVAYAKSLWSEKLPAKLDSAIELTNLIRAVEQNPSNAFTSFSNALGIGNYRYSLVRAAGTATIINEDEILLSIEHADSFLITRLATEYIYGNAVRDASGLVDIKDFTNTTDLNNISEQLNKTIRLEVLPPFKKQVKQGNKIEVVAAVELNKAHINFSDLELIPVRLKIIQ